MIVDTPGFDDTGSLGEMRVQRTKQVLNRIDCAVLVTDCTLPHSDCERQLVSLFEEKKIPYVVAKNKSDKLSVLPTPNENELYVSATNGTGINELRERIARLITTDSETHRLVGDLVKEGELAVLVVPIDSSAPKGRLILPQQQVIRDILESGGCPAVTRETELPALLSKLSEKPAIVITDSQAFAKVSRDVPIDIPLTSFSILMAKYKGVLDTAVKGCRAIDRLKNGDKVLISEGCTHHRQCEDIGTVKLPAWLKKRTGKELEICTSSGREFPEDLKDYALVIHCGGCTLTEREMKYRMKCAEDQNIPFTNYGTAIAYMNGILQRTLAVFPELLAILED
jgi:[FeFe] hydrogenase H-cluster maturation GTPase HydF